MDFIFEHMPFFAVAGMTAVIEYAIPKSRFGRREGAILAGCAGAIGLFWTDPEGLGWDRMTSVAYFACAGLIGITAVSLARGLGYKVTLPGSTNQPPEK